MPCCSLRDCKNRTEQGYRIFRLPQGEQNAKRRKIWLEFVNRPDLLSTAYICEIHFDEFQFETKRADGRKLLTCNAIPTIRNLNLENPATSIVVKQEPIECHIEENVLNTSKMENLSFVNNLQFQRLKNELKTARKKINVLENKIRRLREKYAHTFNQDQVSFFENGDHHRGVEWSEDTMSKALRLYKACGAKGYEEIRNQNLPYPSVRTLQHRTKGKGIILTQCVGS